jgi:hypothetical protein
MRRECFEITTVTRESGKTKYGGALRVAGIFSVVQPESVRCPHLLFGEHLASSELLGKESRRIAEGFELERVTRPIVQKKSSLLAHLSGKADTRLNDEVDTSVLETLSK